MSFTTLSFSVTLLENGIYNEPRITIVSALQTFFIGGLLNNKMLRNEVVFYVTPCRRIKLSNIT